VYDQASSKTSMNSQTTFSFDLRPGSPITRLRNRVGGRDGIMDVFGLVPDGAWQYSLNWGRSWNKGTGNSFRIPNSKYGNGQIQTRQRDKGGAWSDQIIGSPGPETFFWGGPGFTTIGRYDRIIGYESQDTLWISGLSYRTTVSSLTGNIDSLTERNVRKLLRPADFRRNQVAAFTVTGFNGTFIAMNDWASGFKAYDDNLVFLSGFSVDELNTVNVY
jgi:hypothetical protein